VVICPSQVLREDLFVNVAFGNGFENGSRFITQFVWFHGEIQLDGFDFNRGQIVEIISIQREQFSCAGFFSRHRVQIIVAELSQ